MASAAQWISGARPWTLPAALAPVAAGTGAAVALHGGRFTEAFLATAVALALQIGVNFANDYSDGVRGTDASRVGPFRLTASGAAAPRAVLAAALAAFAAAAIAGIVLVVLCRNPWLLAMGALCFPAAWFYTGGSRPYGYRGYGELFVFIFFGLFAVLGTTLSQAGRLSTAAICAAVGVGSLACAILVANNLRDIPTDAAAGKKTLAVRIGDGGTRRLYLILLSVAFLTVIPVLWVHPWTALTFFALPIAVFPAKAIVKGALGRALIPVLRWTGLLELSYGLLFGLSLCIR